MMHAIRPWLILAAFVLLMLPGAMRPCRGADGPGPVISYPLPVVEDPPPASGHPTRDVAEAGPAPTLAQDIPPPFVLPPPPDYSTADHEYMVPEGWIGSPLLERPEAASQGVFFNVESSVVWPHLQNELVGGQVTLGQTSGASPSSAIGLPPGDGLPITGDIVSFSGSPLNAAVSPRFELGYRFPDGFGELSFRYRFLDATGSDTLTVGDLGPAAQASHLHLNFFDLAFGTREFSLGPGWTMRTAVGLRLATASFQSQVNFLTPVTVTEQPFGTGPFTRLFQTEGISNFYGGVIGILEVGHRLWIPELSLFGRVEGSGLYGRVHQTFKETFVESPGSTEISVIGGVGTPLLTPQVGLSYEVPSWNHSRIMVGYQYEIWWQFGRGDDDLSFGALFRSGPVPPGRVELLNIESMCQT